LESVESSVAKEQAGIPLAELPLRAGSEALFRDLILSLPAALYSTDCDGCITLFNEDAAAMWGRRPEIGKDMWCGAWRIYRIDGTLLPHDECPLALTLKSGLALRNQEIVVERPDGKRTHVLANPQPLLDDSGEMIGAVNMLVDISDRKRVEVALGESEIRLRAIFNQAAVGIALVSTEGRYLDVNDRLCHLLGYERADLLRLSCADVTHPEDWPCNVTLISRIARGEIAEFTVEKRYRRRDGSYIWVNVAVSPLLDETGKPERLVAIIEDVSANKAAEEQIQEMNRLLEARVVDRTAQLEAFCYSIAHDLRQHIRGVSINAHLVTQLVPQLDPEVHDSLSRLVGAAKSMDRLVTDLLSYARSSRHNIRRETVDLTHLASEIAYQLQATYPEAFFRIAPDLEAIGDPASLGVVLQNLMENACKYRCEERPPIVDIGQANGSFHVKDNGAGFEMKYSHQVFEPFTRLHRHSEVPGTGIGLASVKQIVEKHGGSVWVESEPGNGAAFYFSLK
jgi:PAS domain S-box-containing protein